MEGVFFPKKKTHQLWVEVCVAPGTVVRSLRPAGPLAGGRRGGNRLVMNEQGAGAGGQRGAAALCSPHSALQTGEWEVE